MRARRNGPRRHFRLSLLAVALSVVFPGAGHLYLGSKRRGWWFAGIAATLWLGGLALLWRSPAALLKLVFDPVFLIALLVVNAAVFAFRSVAVIDAYRMTGPPDVSRPVSVLAGLAVAAVVLAPHVVIAYYDAVQYDLIHTVFASPITTATVPATTTLIVTTVSAPGETSTVPPSTTTIPTTTAPPGPWDELDRLNILLLGSDAGVGRTGVRTDTMILASLDVDTGDLALIGIPRNIARVPLPEEIGIFSCDCFPPILNELYQYATDRPDLFPGPATPGANAIKGAVAELTGLPVHYFALVSLDGFVEVVDAIGGVTISVTESVYDPVYPNEDGTTSAVNLQPGVYDFDGHEALIYARSRYSSDDYDRMGRQRCVVEAVIDQADPFTLLRNYPKLAEVIRNSVETDIPLDAVPDLIDLVSIVDADGAVSLRLVPPTYVAGWTEERYSIPDVELIHEHAAIATTLTPAEAMAVLGIDPLEDGCG